VAEAWNSAVRGCWAYVEIWWAWIYKYSAQLEILDNEVQF
jgi:hypothetical protein